MARMRPVAGDEGRAAAGATARGVALVGLAVLLWTGMSRWPVEWEWPNPVERDRIELVGVGCLGVLAVWARHGYGPHAAMDPGSQVGAGAGRPGERAPRAAPGVAREGRRESR